MTESKSFKNPDLTVFNDGSGWKITPSGVTKYSGNHNWFHSSDWDMEVTFTKKQPKPEVGGTCHRQWESDITVYTIIAVNEDLVWIRDQNDSPEENTGWIEPISYLKDFKPWQPA